MKKSQNQPDAELWYRDGLHFECTRCGACCTGEPGYVWVDIAEIEAMAAQMGLSRDEFSLKYVRRIGARHSLREKPGGDCILWDRDRGCTVYESRPIQCQTWPFWPENIESRSDWDHICSICPGSGTGNFYSLEEIQAQARRVHPDE
jgi:Fe-S-cluster containining protein